MLRPTWRAVYDSIKDDDDGIWFMCEEMVQDCSDRGGCCSRGCGCCARRRHLSKGEKGKGHCTSECWCCISCRGFDLPEEEKEEIASYMKRWLEEFSSPYLLNMANAFFCPLKPKVKSKPKAESQSTLRRLFERGWNWRFKSHEKHTLLQRYLLAISPLSNFSVTSARPNWIMWLSSIQIPFLSLNYL